MNFRKKIIIVVVGCVLIFFAGIGAGTLLVEKMIPGGSCKTSFKFLNPKAECEGDYPIEKHEYTLFRDGLDNFLKSQKAEGKVSSASVYFRDLYNGPTFGIEERVSFSPASLLKLPLVLTFLKLTEDDPKILQKQLVYKRHQNEITEMGQFFPPKESIEEDKPYSIDDLLRRIIVFSDNNTYDVLFTYLSQTKGSDALLETYRELGVIYPQSNLENTITVKSYASIFRLLYQASYLPPELSEKVLTILSESDFRMGLVAGVPKGIEVAHKFGERVDLTANLKQLHDCGIIYYPDNPYLLCVMTRGKDFEELVSVINTISKMVYEEVELRKL